MLRCLAIDDEPMALRLIANDIRRIPFLNLIQVFESAFEAADFLDKEAVDLIFLDIRMPTLSGLAFLRQLKAPPLVILTTAYEQYALDAYELNIVDYLLKPIPAHRFLQAVEKARQLVELRTKVALLLDGQFILVHSEYKVVRILLQDILYIEGLGDYVKIFTSRQPTRPILTRLNLKRIETKIEHPQFLRIHQSFIVSLPKIESYGKTKVTVAGKEIPIGKNYQAVFEKVYQGR